MHYAFNYCFVFFWVRGYGYMFGIYETSKFKYLYEFGCPTKHGNFSSLNKQSTNLHRDRFPIGGSKILGDSHPTYIPSFL